MRRVDELAAADVDAHVAEPVEEEAPASGEEQAAPTATLSEERFKELQAKEEFVLTVASSGFGKRSSAYEYRVSNRGGLGIANITLSRRTGTEVAATLPVRSARNLLKH